MSNQARIAERRNSLLKQIRILSRVEVCHATDIQLAAAIGCCESTIETDLDALEAEGKITRVRFEPMSHVSGTTLINGGRWICLVSPLDVDPGAQAVARLVSLWLPRKVYPSKLLGPLGCTRKQLDLWIRRAEELGLVTCERHGFGKLSFELLVQLAAWWLPKDRSYVEWLPWTYGKQVREVVEGKQRLVGNKARAKVQPVLNDAGKVRRFLLRKLEWGPYSGTRAQLAKDLGVALSTVKAVVTKLVKTGELHSTPFAAGKGRGTILSFVPLTEEERLTHTPELTRADMARDDAAAERDRAATKVALAQLEAVSPLTQEELVQDAILSVMATTEELNRWWTPAMLVDQADLRERVRSLAPAYDQREACDLARKLHRQHRAATVTPDSFVVDTLAIKVDSVDAVRDVMLADYFLTYHDSMNGLWAEIGKHLFLDITREQYESALEAARRHTSTGWVVAIAADLLLAKDNPSLIDDIRRRRREAVLRDQSTGGGKYLLNI